MTELSHTGWQCPACRRIYDTYADAKCCREIPQPVRAEHSNIVFDSGRYYVCDLCHEVIAPNTSMIVQGNSAITRSDDLQVAHKQCHHDTRTL